jgi:hypothetical protein
MGSSARVYQKMSSVESAQPVGVNRMVHTIDLSYQNHLLGLTIISNLEFI